MGNQTKPTIAQAVAQALSDLQAPIPQKEFVEMVLTIRPSSAKNPASSIRNHLRWQENGKSIAYLDRKTLVPLRTAMRGVRYRYCEHCEAKGEKTRATWICIDCSYEADREVLVCKDCLRSEHMEHYADQILY